MALERPLRKILCATDFSSTAEAAVEWAAALAALEGAELHVAHVWQLPELVTPTGTFASLASIVPEVEREVDEKMRELARFWKIAGSHVRRGTPDVELTRLAGELPADLVVVGTHGRTGLSHVLLGSVAERVIRTSPAPVATVPGGWRTIPDEPVRRVLVPCDFEGGAERAVAEGLALAERLGAAIDLLHVLDLPAYVLRGPMLPDIESSARRDLAELGGRHATATVPINTHIRAGIVGDTIAAVARELAVDLVLLPTHGRRGVARFFLGSVAERVARTASRPVLTVRTADGPER